MKNARAWWLWFVLPVGVSAAVIADLLVLSAMGGVALPSPLGNPGAPGSSIAPLGTALALGAPTEAVAGGENWYNFSVQAAGSGITFQNTQFELQSPTGAAVTTPLPWAITMTDANGIVLGEYAGSGGGNGSWVSGATTVFSALQVVSLSTSGTDLAGHGDSLIVIGEGGYTGMISVPVP